MKFKHVEPYAYCVHVSRVAPFSPSLRKAIREAGGRFTKITGHSDQRYVTIPAREDTRGLFDRVVACAFNARKKVTVVVEATGSRPAWVTVHYLLEGDEGRPIDNLVNAYLKVEEEWWLRFGQHIEAAQKVTAAIERVREEEQAEATASTQAGVVLVFRKGISVERAYQAVIESLGGLIDASYYVGGQPTVHEFNPNEGGPVWYIP